MDDSSGEVDLSGDRVQGPVQRADKVSEERGGEEKSQKQIPGEAPTARN